MSEVQKNTAEINCKQCGAKLTYAPGTNQLKCEYCGAQNDIAKSDEKIEEIDFFKFLKEFETQSPKQDLVTVKCESCGAQTSFDANVTSDSCAFCGSPIVAGNQSVHHLVQPKSLLPFQVDRKKGLELYQKWIKGLWFAPGKLKQYARTDAKFAGMYIPYWTYDAATTSRYTGERGTDYYRTETYTTTENGQSVTKTRQVKDTVWTRVSGTVYDNFDDVLIIASQSLPKKYAEKLEPWDLENLVPYNPNYLSGYKTECYQVDLKEGFEESKGVMAESIRQTICKDIGGDHQRVSSVDSSYNNVTFKHILLPIWLSAYRYNNKAYRFLINGRTGEVQGERPYSWIKITLTILAVIAVIGIIAVIANQ